MAVSAPDWGEGGVGGIQMSNSQAHELTLEPWRSQDAVASAALDPPVRASHSDQGLPESVVITMLHQSATGSKAFCGVGWTRRPCGCGCCKIAQ